MVSAILSYQYGGLIKTAAISVSLFVLDGFLVIRGLMFLEAKLMKDIDDDHKKYL